MEFLVKKEGDIMTTDALASVQVLINSTLAYFLNVCQHADLAHAYRSVTPPQGCPAAVLRLCYLHKYARLIFLSAIYAAEKWIRIIPA